jgi:hypothetical protein
VIRLERHEQSAQGTFGRLVLPAWSCFTVEREWRENLAGNSCIPPGAYTARWVFSPRFKRPTYRLVGTEPRVGILVHAANLARQLNGCIALGLSLGWMDGVKAVLLSAPAVREFEMRMGGAPFEMEIR